MRLLEKFSPKSKRLRHKSRDRPAPAACTGTERGHPGTMMKVVKGQKLGILAQVMVQAGEEDAQNEQTQTIADELEARTIAEVREHLASEREGMCVIPTSQADAESEAI